MQILSVNLFDKTGIIRKSIKFGKGNRQVDLHASELPANVYYLEVNDGIQNARVR